MSIHKTLLQTRTTRINDEFYPTLIKGLKCDIENSNKSQKYNSALSIY